MLSCTRWRTFVIDKYGIENGVFTFVRAVFAADFELPNEAR